MDGYSIGKWDGDTFVITSTGYDERTWLDHLGNPHSDQMVLVERWKHPERDTLVTLDMTITDPKAYTAPWVGDTVTFVRAKAAVFEELCVPSKKSTSTIASGTPPSARPNPDPDSGTPHKQTRELTQKAICSPVDYRQSWFAPRTVCQRWRRQFPPLV